MIAVLGIDPGLDGALVVLVRDASGVRCVEQYCTRDLCPDGYVPERMDAAVSEAIVEWAPTLAVLERVHARPGEGVSSSFRFGVGWGLWRGILAGRISSVLEPTPHPSHRVWRRGTQEHTRVSLCEAASSNQLNTFGSSSGISPWRARACLIVTGHTRRGDSSSNNVPITAHSRQERTRVPTVASERLGAQDPHMTAVV